MAAVISTKERIKSVQIEGLALLKIVKHCHDSLPHMVAGSLLGLEMENGVLEITHSFPLPVDTSKHNGAGGEVIAENAECHKYQEEMMRMLRDVNVDNNCVGWYQSMYMGIYSTSSLLENQLSYQMGLGPNSVAILYDPMQTKHGNFVLKCYRLTEKCVNITSTDSNEFISPNDIFEEVPVELTNPGLVKVLLEDVADGAHNEDGGLHASNADTTFDRLDLTTNPYLEKHLEFLSGWMDDLAAEQHKFQYYTRQLSRGSKDKSRRKADIAAGWATTDAPRRLESLLISNQIRSYCDQMDIYTSGGLNKLFLTEGIHKEE